LGKEANVKEVLLKLKGTFLMSLKSTSKGCATFHVGFKRTPGTDPKREEALAGIDTALLVGKNYLLRTGQTVSLPGVTLDLPITIPDPPLDQPEEDKAVLDAVTKPAGEEESEAATDGLEVLNP
jgi:hypothetical protein